MGMDPAVGVQIVPAQAPGAVERAAQRLLAGGLVAMPTETVYGLAAHADDPVAVDAVFAAKGRPRGHPLIVHVANAAAVDHYAAEVPPAARTLMAAFWPGPLTLILPRRADVAEAAAGGQHTIGLRCPSHPAAQDLLAACALLGMHGLAAPSANRFGRISPTTAVHVAQEFDGMDLLVLDGGACPVGIESAILDLSRPIPALLRPGTVARAAIERVLGTSVAVAAGGVPDPSAPRAPGTLASHYAPRAIVRLMNAGQLRSALEVLGPQAVPLAVYARTSLRSPSRTVVIRSMPQDAAAAAQDLFGALRDLDAQGVPLIWVETPPDDPAWDGVRDRLHRASADRGAGRAATGTIPPRHDTGPDGGPPQEQA